MLFGCGSGGGFPDARAIDAPPPKGTFSLAWTITDTSAQPINCDTIGGTGISVNAHNLGASGGNPEVFSCSTGMGKSQGVPPGTYEMSFELDGISGTLATAPSQTGIVITANADTPLQPITFAVDATGGLDLSLSSGKGGGNCGAVAAMGAGITNTTITLQDSTGACAPVTFQISAGATKPAGTYTVDCAAPVLGPCIEHDQHLTATGLRSGNYTVHVRGKIGAADCYLNNDSFAVPPLGHSLMSTLNLGFATGTPGC
jgi:hypothetical protein